MTEKLTHQEKNFSPEIHERHEHESEAQKQARHEREQAAEDQPERSSELATHAREVIKDEAISKESGIPTETTSHDESVLAVTPELRRETWQRSLSSLRKHLSPPKRAFSKVIHQPVVDTVSHAGAVTVARPSGLLGGSIFAFIGSSFFLYMAKHYGFYYNYLIFLLFFVGGFAVGLVLELALFALRRKKA